MPHKHAAFYHSLGLGFSLVAFIACLQVCLGSPLGSVLWKPSERTKRSCVYFSATLPFAAWRAPSIRSPSQTVITEISWCHHGLLKQPIMFNSLEWCFITVKMIFTRESAGKSLSPSIIVWRRATSTLVPTQNQITSLEEMNPLSKQLVCNIKYVF